MSDEYWGGFPPRSKARINYKLGNPCRMNAREAVQRQFHSVDELIDYIILNEDKFYFYFANSILYIKLSKDAGSKMSYDAFEKEKKLIKIHYKNTGIGEIELNNTQDDKMFKLYNKLFAKKREKEIKNKLKIASIILLDYQVTDKDILDANLNN